MTHDDASTSAAPHGFIVGMPRAATTWLCKCLNEHPQACAFGESMFFGRRYTAPQSDGRYSPAQVRTIVARLGDGTCVHAVSGEGPGYLRRISRDTIGQCLAAVADQLPDRPTPAEMFRWLCEAITRAEGKSVWVEKTPHHLNWLDRIIGALPQARIVIMLREPYGFMLSYKHQGDRKPEYHRKQLARLYHPFACAMVWRASMRSALDARERYPGHVMWVQQDELQDNPAAILCDVQAFYGLEEIDVANELPRDNTSFPGGIRPELSGADVLWMNLVAGRTMSRAGYKRRPIPFQPLGILWSVARLPIWAVTCLFMLRTRVDGSLTRYIFRWFRPQRSKAAATVSA